MTPTPEELRLGGQAAQRVRLYEKYAARNRVQTPWILAGCAVLLLLLAASQGSLSARNIFVFGLLTSAVFLWNWAQNRIARDRYADQKMIVRLLEEKYGDALPWVMEAKNLARVRDLEAEIARTGPQAG